jgi:hypothetical protein
LARHFLEFTVYDYDRDRRNDNQPLGVIHTKKQKLIRNIQMHYSVGPMFGPIKSCRGVQWHSPMVCPSATFLNAIGIP